MGQELLLSGISTSDAFVERYVAFSQALRRAGVATNIERIETGLRAVEAVGIGNRSDVRDALEAVLISSETDRILFRNAFELWFSVRDSGNIFEVVSEVKISAEQTLAVGRRLTRAAPPWAKTPTKAREGSTIELEASILPSARERLRHADFSALSEDEFEVALSLARNIPLELPRLSVRRHTKGSSASARGSVDWLASMRESCQTGGELLRLARSVPRRESVPVLALVDVSGSMKQYARISLTFLHCALKSPTRRDVFAFGTRLTDLKMCFKSSDSEVMLQLANSKIMDFSGGTRIGQSLSDLRRNYHHRIAHGRTLLVLITDGLETGDISLLEKELAWLRRNVRYIVWLNPMLKYEQYTNATRGAKIFARYVDVALAVHNLNSLEGLSDGLASAVGALRKA